MKCPRDKQCDQNTVACTTVLVMSCLGPFAAPRPDQGGDISVYMSRRSKPRSREKSVVQGRAAG